MEAKGVLNLVVGNIDAALDLTLRSHDLEYIETLNSTFISAHSYLQVSFYNAMHHTTSCVYW